MMVATIVCAMSGRPALAQHLNASGNATDNQPKEISLDKPLQYKLEMQGSLSKGRTPLWLNANKHGLSSLKEANGYIRAAVERPLSTDSMRRWGVGYGADIVAAAGYDSHFLVQQAYVEARWLHGVLSAGSKETPMELKNNRLSSGSQTLGINARPVPQLRLALPQYWDVPGTNGWLHFKGHLAYGITTDDRWQKDFTGGEQSHTENVHFHSKAGYLKVGKENCYYPFSLEAGLEMAALFGGKCHVRKDDGSIVTHEGESGLAAYWHALKPAGHDAEEDTYQNVAGDLMGSWVARVNYDADTWKLSFYADKFFEDHSAMFQLDYDGYGSGEEWMDKKRRRYLIYNFKDMLLGVELAFKYDHLIRHVLLEYIYTKYQSGPIYHDHTPPLADHIGGDDNYYNHHLYRGWQHWGQVMGNPLYRSPAYNDDGTITVKNNRFKALHFGIDGGSGPLEYRFMATCQEGAGTYQDPYHHSHYNLSVMAEASWHFNTGKLCGWSVKGACGMDIGGILGNNYGAQFTITRQGILNQRHRK